MDSNLTFQIETLFAAIDNNPSSIIITNKHGIIEYVNQAFTENTGYSYEEAIGQNPKIFKSGLHVKQFYEKLWATLANKQTWKGTFIDKHKNGSFIYENTMIIPILDSDNEIINYLAIKQNMTNEYNNQEKMEHILIYDELTDIPNRSKFINDLNSLITTTDQKAAIGIIDIDNFKDVNDLFGHDYGDKILIEISKILKTVITENTNLYKLSGDEFAFIINDIKSKNDIISNMLSIINEMRQTHYLDDENTFYNTVSIGITCWPEDAITTTDIIRNADLALYNAKKEGKDKFSFWFQGLNDTIKHKKDIEHLLRELIENENNDQLQLYYQPQIDLKTGKLVGAEALLRWFHPEKGYMPPPSYIGVAEETGAILPLTIWILETAFIQIQKWAEMGIIDFNISVNIPGQLYKPNILPKIIDAILNKTKIDPSFVGLEITETTLIGKFDEALTLTKHFKDMGIEVFIDDFGTGYSNLNLLRRLPVSKIKIDKTFIDNIKESNPDVKDEMGLPEAVIQLGHSFGMKIVAEGIETDFQSNALFNMGCEIGQGWLWSKALSAKEFEAFMRKHLTKF
jgi:diguanylate cyclase (GGDEF)-like protein/PAS domain S-box-containing protein